MGGHASPQGNPAGPPQESVVPIEAKCLKLLYLGELILKPSDAYARLILKSHFLNVIRVVVKR